MSGIDSFTKLMLHGDGTNGSTTVTDSSASVHTQTAHGSCSLTTSFYKFVTAALKFAASTFDWLAASSSSDFDFGSGDFTIDYWVYQLSHTSPVVHVAREQNTTFPPFLMGYGGSQVYMSSTGTSWDVASGKTLGAEVINGWSHLALVRSGTTFYTFRDGVQQDTWTSSATLPTKTGVMGIGSGQSGNYMNGYIDELRVSKGIARWTSNFTPPTSAYSSSTYTPLVVSGTCPLTATASNNSYVDLIDTSGVACNHYVLDFIGAVSDLELIPVQGGVLTAYVTTNAGTSFDTGPYYNNTGTSNFPGENNLATLPLPYALDTPQTLNLGCRLGIDFADTLPYGASGSADFYYGGGSTMYTATGYRGGVGGSANDIRGANCKQPGSAWFNANGTSPFHWAIPVQYAGHYDGAPGSQPNGFRLMMNGGTVPANIVAGTFILRRVG